MGMLGSLQHASFLMVSLVPTLGEMYLAGFYLCLGWNLCRAMDFALFFLQILLVSTTVETEKEGSLLSEGTLHLSLTVFWPPAMWQLPTLRIVQGCGAQLQVGCTLLGEDDKLILCDECNKAFHLFCLRPALYEIPDGEWQCPACQPSTARRSSRGRWVALLSFELSLMQIFSHAFTREPKQP